MSQVIDGKALALKHQEKLEQKLKNINHPPKLVSFCNKKDPSSILFTTMKFKKAQELGIEFISEYYNDDVTAQEIKTKIEDYNQDPTVDGIMMQLPLPDELSEQKDELLNTLDPKKDVDGLTNKGRQNYLPATIKGILSILENSNIKLDEKSFAVVGSEGMVGKPLVETLKNQGYKVSEYDQEKGDLKDLINADIIISCTGIQELIKPTMVQDNAILIDVGLGDFDERCFNKSSFHTPKFGGVGPMTIISLMENVLKSFEKNLI